MGDTISATNISGGVKTTPNGAEAIYELTLDTTTAGGIMTLDLTDDFGYVTTAHLGGSDAAAFYNVEIQQPASDTALSATNLALGFSEAGADGAVLDLVGSADLSAAITGLTLRVTGKPSTVSSWA